MPVKRTARGVAPNPKTKRGRPRRGRQGAPSQGRKKLEAGLGKAVRVRLRQYVEETYQTQYEVREAFGIARSTAAAWFGKTSETIPDIGSIWPLVELGLSLDWLFTGEGHPQRLRDSSAPRETFTSVLEAHLKAESGLEAAEAMRILGALMEVSVPHGKDDLFRFAIEGALEDFIAFRELLNAYGITVGLAESRYREDFRSTEVVKQLVDAIGDSAESLPELAGGLFDYAVHAYEQRVRGWQRSIDFLLKSLDGPTPSTSVRYFRAWAEKRWKWLDSRSPLPLKPMTDDEIVRWPGPRRP
jgi:transcriptional regulator with XRE-family HTH domain